MRTSKKYKTSQMGSTQVLESDNTLQYGRVINNKYKLLEKIGEGSFGMVYKVQNLENGEICAAKFEQRVRSLERVSLLIRETKVLMDIKNHIGLPNLQYYGRTENYNFIMMDFLGYNLEQLLRKCSGIFTVTTCLNIGIQMIDRIEALHNKNIIHRDIKPENLLVYLIDFGLSKYYKDSKGKHISWTDNKGMIGTARYASLNAHLGYEQGRRDDMEAIGYVLIYFLKSTLPWMNIPEQNKKEKYVKIYQLKQQISIDQLCHGLPQCIKQYFLYLKQLTFTDSPNYQLVRDYFKNQLIDIQNKQKVCDTLFDWEQLQEFRYKKFEQSYVASENQVQLSQQKQENQIPQENQIIIGRQQYKEKLHLTVPPISNQYLQQQQGSLVDSKQIEYQQSQDFIDYQFHLNYQPSNRKNYQIAQLSQLVPFNDQGEFNEFDDIHEISQDNTSLTINNFKINRPKIIQ